MGCLMSKENAPEKQAGAFDDGSSQSERSRDANDSPPATPARVKPGRVGISTISSSSNSSSSGSSGDGARAHPYRLVEKLARGIQEISDDSKSDDESSLESYELAARGGHRLGSPDATSASSHRDNQSIDDIGDESVVDWLAESTTLFTSTTVGDERLERDYIRSSGSNLNAILPLPEHVAKSEPADHSVKDTVRVERRHAPLPSDNAATKGDWLTNRYVVNDYIVLSGIGRGAHSEVRLCKHKATNELFACKIMNRTLLKSKVDIQKEVAIMKKLRHTNILRLYEVLDDPKVNKVYLVTELAHRGDLMNIVKKDARRPHKRNVLSDEKLRDIARQVMKGLLFLHQNNITHNDLKPSNLLVNGDGVIKIADFGVSGLGRVRLDSAGTPAFMAPEVVTGEIHDGQLADVYALGATIFCIRYERPPFVGRGVQMNQKLLDLYDQIKHAPLAFPDGRADEGLKDLISNLMARDPMRRLRLLDALEHPWLREGE